ncbi:MAG: sigma-70 family RNA polymerase sigma factor [Candidatus Obscuribacterales bacterium]|nr:sigma-70 family RNA polymerase sigma factor [Candidatus Obscuribacterales bacterium]
MKFFQNRRKEFEKLSLPLGPELFRLAYWRMANMQDAEDVVQEAYLRGFRSFHTFQSGTNIKAWMTRILINVVNDTLKKRIRQPDVLPMDDDCDQSLEQHSASARDPEVQLIENEIRPDLLEALQKLPTDLLQPLLLRELQEMTYDEIATVLSIPTGTVMSRLFRARRLLRDRLTNKVSKHVKREVEDHEMQ